LNPKIDLGLKQHKIKKLGIFLKKKTILENYFFAKFKININRLIVINLRCSGKDPKQRTPMTCAKSCPCHVPMT